MAATGGGRWPGDPMRRAVDLATLMCTGWDRLDGLATTAPAAL